MSIGDRCIYYNLDDSYIITDYDKRQSAPIDTTKQISETIICSNQKTADKIGKMLEPDIVNHPSHYTEGRKYEPIDVIEDWGLNYHTGNALKYISRAGRKGDYIEDLKKAVFYLQREIEKTGEL